MKYDKSILQYIAVRLETISNKTRIAEEVKKAFKLEQPIEIIRKAVSRHAIKLGVKARTADIKRLFFDIETSYCIGWFWRPSWKTSIGPHQIIQDKKIICISYKWQDSDTVHNLKWDSKQDDTKMIKDFVKVLGKADEIIAHNGDRFDMKELRTRCIKEGVLMFPKYRTLDTLLKARQYFSFPSNKLDEIGKYLGLGEKIHTDYTLWNRIILDKCKVALKEMIAYCDQDVMLLESIFVAMQPYILHNTNFAVKLGKDKYCCPECAGENVKLSHTDTTPYGYIKRNFKCRDCKKFYVISNKTYLQYLKDTYRLEV